MSWPASVLFALFALNAQAEMLEVQQPQREDALEVEK